MKKYTIGIDTGGTYTDGVIIDNDNKVILAKAKQSTTHHDLAIGSGKVIRELLTTSGVRPDNIVNLIVSSTLATNSVVENKGARVALLVIGYVRHFKLPVKAVIYLKGGHTITGAEEEPLELEYLVETVTSLKDEVDAYGVCSAMSIKNPAHELVAEKAITMLDPKPVFCSHRTSNIAGMQERAATAGLHAKLMPVMKHFIDGIQQGMEESNINCPLFIVNGNGKIIPSEKAVEFAGGTVASGPACTALFGAQHTQKDALIVDVGGTTTDIAMIRDGKPLLAPEGCEIGGWRTHVEAVDMFTGGIGGDSHVHVNKKAILTLGPGRVIPLAMADQIPEIDSWLGVEEKTKLVMLQDEESCNDDCEVVGFLKKHGPATLKDIYEATGLGGVTIEKRLEHLFRRQSVTELGFTPTDALHVLDQISLGNKQQAYKGAMILGSALNLSPEQFSTEVIKQTTEKIATLILEYICRQYWGTSLTNFLSTRNSHPLIGVDFTIKVPLVGVGAAAPHLLPQVAERLHTEVVFPENCEVGNAIGAANLLTALEKQIP